MPGLRVAVLGLYNSGSTALAGMLHRLGVDMGPPFWKRDDPEAGDNYYEPKDLAGELRTWWNEPRLRENAPASERRRYLARWIQERETHPGSPVGAKHPLLSLCGPDLKQAWGTTTLFLWSYRPLEESVAGLVRRRWFRGFEMAMQSYLWKALHAFAGDSPGVIRIEWRHLKAEPASTARKLSTLLRLAPSPDQVDQAARFIRTAR